MTPTEAGVREYCANTRETGNLRYFDRNRRERRFGIG
ncbi:hypothetical protein SRABI13_02060 [Erwinia aphidicola]|nr:hypothetical protein SRABI13_02060 [Erwinia aphidicola]